MISDALARKLFAGQSAIGRKMKLYKRATWGIVVGVVHDVGLEGPHQRPPYQLYESMSAAPERATLVYRTARSPVLMETAVRKAVREAAPLVQVRNVVNVESDLSAGRAMHRFVLGLLGAFALLAVLLAAVGLHAVISYNVQQRWREIGIRIALGAPGAGIARMVVQQGVVLAIVGALTGVVVAIFATRAMSDLLYGIAPGDPATLAAVSGLLVVVALIAARAPASRASRIDPVEMLRAE
jgi:predicted lysophospholipase L1 biosynthesis ABC-type transport system permease subunit